MVSAAELVSICRTDMLMTGGRDARNRLQGAISATAESLVLQYPHQLAPNDRVSVGFEDMGVWQVSGQTIAVERGDEGSTAAAHAAGAKALLNARFTPNQVLRSMRSEIESLSSQPGLYRVAFHTFTANASTSTYPLTGLDPSAILEVSAEVTGTADWEPISRWTLQRTAANTASLALFETAHGQMRVAYRRPYGAITATTADVAATVGVADPTIVAVGAALRLTRGRAIRRSFVEGQGDSRRASEVSGFDITQADLPLERWYRQLIDAEKARLQQRFPVKRRATQWG